jgi:hypothetical protein
MANERSASEGSFYEDGVEVNHQFSKGLEAERALRAALREAVGPAPEWFSLLRPASELAIARAFARLPQYHHAFTSCNTVFRLDPARRRTHWCGECDKCRFVFLILAPFLAPDRLVPIFGRDLFAEPEQLPGFLALLGLDAHKPFECVGTVAESVAAARLAAADPGWSTRPVVAALAERIARDVPPGAGDPADALRLAAEDCVPAAYRTAVEAALGA